MKRAVPGRSRRWRHSLRHSLRVRLIVVFVLLALAMAAVFLGGMQRAFSTGYFRPYTNSDVVGAEVGGACKNVIALACGMAAGVGLGRRPATTGVGGPRLAWRPRCASQTITAAAGSPCHPGPGGLDQPAGA